MSVWFRLRLPQAKQSWCKQGLKIGGITQEMWMEFLAVKPEALLENFSKTTDFKWTELLVQKQRRRSAFLLKAMIILFQIMTYIFLQSVCMQRREEKVMLVK